MQQTVYSDLKSVLIPQPRLFALILSAVLNIEPQWIV